jgi:phage tail-like protein
MNKPVPAGYSWNTGVILGGSTIALNFDHTYFGDHNASLTWDYDDVAINIAGLGAETLEVFLGMGVDSVTPGALLTDIDITLPSLYIDQLLVPETTADWVVANRFPPPNQTGVPSNILGISFHLLNPGGGGFNVALLDVSVGGTQAIIAGVAQPLWSSTVTTAQGPTGNDVIVSIDLPTGVAPYESETKVDVVISYDTYDGSYTFITEDLLQPAVNRAEMYDKDILRVRFTDSVLMDTSANGALNTENYKVARVSQPAVTIDVVAAAQVDHNTVDLTFNWEASQGAIYSLLSKDIADDEGNVLAPAAEGFQFRGYVPPRPLGRRFELLDFIPNMNKAEDLTAAQGGNPNAPGTGELRKFILCLQDVTDLLLCSIDEWSNIIDPDLAPEPFLDAMLQDLGNPFAECIADLNVNDKRLLALVLISIYKEKGTEPGVINAIRFFLGIEVTLDIINCRQWWQLDVSLLGNNTLLGPSAGNPLWYSFWVVSPVVLTESQRERILCIAQYMRGANEHVLGIQEPGDVVTQSEYFQENEAFIANYES